MIIVLFLKLIGIAMILKGLYTIIKPISFRKMMGSLVKRKRLWVVVILKILFGLILLVLADYCRVDMVIKIMGLLYVIGGIGAIFIGHKKLREMCRWWEARPFGVIRLWGVAAVLWGALVFSLV